MNENYISVLMIQAEVDVAVNLTSEFSIPNSRWKKQLYHSIELAQKYKPDIMIYPETFYNVDYYNEFIKLNNHVKIVIAGSTYIDGENYTAIVENDEVTFVKKNNPSPLEVASKYSNYQDFDDLCENGLWDKSLHTFQIKNKDIIILNCMEYYNSSHLIARSKKYNKNLFGIFCPCSSSNVDLFEHETATINNHQENIYTFLCNRISPNPKSTTKGQSYVYGIVARTERDLLKQEYPNNCNLTHLCGIARLNNEPQYIYGEYAINNNFSPFGRSDNFRTTPKNLIIGKLEQ